MKRIFILLIVASFVLNFIQPCHAYVLMPDYLCELGLNFYHQGRIQEALHELNKALLIRPGYEPALRYIDMIRSGGRVTPSLITPLVPKVLPGKPLFREPKVKTREEAIKDTLDRIEKPVPPGIPFIEIPKEEEKKVVMPQALLLDQGIKELRFPLEIERAKAVIIRGHNIKRFLVTHPQVLAAEKLNKNEVLITGNDFGHTYLHLWDDSGRWTLEFLTVPLGPAGPSYEEAVRKAEEQERSFKLRYSMDWSSYEIGRRLDSLERASYSYRHYLGLSGPTPYGNLDSYLTLSSLKQSTDLTYFTMGLTEARLGQFEDFQLRGFDYSPDIYNLIFGGRQLRGLTLSSPAFNNKIDYEIFWGRESGGRYGGLSPGLSESKNSFLSGISLNYFLSNNQTYGLSIFKGWGRDREDYLNPYGYDLQADWNLEMWDLGYEIAYNSDSFAQLFNAVFKAPRLRLLGELRSISRDFVSMTGRGWRAGELGWLFTLDYRPAEKLDITSRLDIFRDRLYPSTDNENRWNTDFEWAANYRLDGLTSLRLDYRIYNDLGSLFKSRLHDIGLGLNRSWDWVRRINTYINYRHQENKNFSSPGLDYINDKVMLGASVNLIADLYYYLNQDFNWLKERYNASEFTPRVLETGVNWSSQVANTPFYGNLRFYFHDEENANSSLSFLSGEDYIEGYSELSYRPNPDKEIYGSVRVRNVWAENPNVTKRIEADFNAGMRYVWDSGFRWESVGRIEGFVFKDLNSDGLMQEGEMPVEGIKLWLGKKKTATSDKSGHYEFPPVRAYKAYISLDVQSLPAGYVLTVPSTQVAMIAHNQAGRIDFGIISRSEIYGLVFEDIDGNAEYGRSDKAIKNVRLVLEDGSEAVTDEDGRYRFSNITPGLHFLKLDLNTLPVDYIPMVSVKKEMDVFEGMSYNYNFPCLKQLLP